MIAAKAANADDWISESVDSKKGLRTSIVSILRRRVRHESDFEMLCTMTTLSTFASSFNESYMKKRITIMHHRFLTYINEKYSKLYTISSVKALDDFAINIYLLVFS